MGSIYCGDFHGCLLGSFVRGGDAGDARRCDTMRVAGGVEWVGGHEGMMPPFTVRAGLESGGDGWVWKGGFLDK
jgi:hypothetical protein